MESTLKLSSPEEELAYLRAQVARKERELIEAHPNQAAPLPHERARIVSEEILNHRERPSHEVLAPDYRITSGSADSIAEDIVKQLELGDDAEPIGLLRATMEREGIRNAFTVLERLRDPHITDDFHRYLVRYVSAGLPVVGMNEQAPRFEALHMTLYEIALPEPKAESDETGRAKTLKELISAMEQFYAGMLAVESATRGEPHWFALELAVPSDKAELQFFAAVPNSKRELFEKQLLAIYPDAHVSPQENDYNIFISGGTSVASVATYGENPALPLKDYQEFDYDPINTILNAFANIEHEGEGAALQIIIEPRSDRHVQHYRKVLHGLRKGLNRYAAFATPETMMGEFAKEISDTFFSSKPKDVEKAKEAERRQIEENKDIIDRVERKVSSPIVGASVRLVVSSKNASKSTQVLGELEAAFNQFSDTGGNHLVFKRIPPRPGPANRAFEEFSFRLPAMNAIPMSLRELTTVYHFPPTGIRSSPQLKQSRFTHASAPHYLATEGILLGINTYRGAKTDIRLASDDRLRHLYIIGQTGTGKSGLLQSLVIQDIQNGEGCCYIDPHGNDVLDVLAAIPPTRYQDVIYFDPADLSRPFGLNFLEYDVTRPEQKTFIVNELLMIFRRLYGDVPESMGPAFEQYFRNATQLVMEDPASGSTVLDIARVLADEEFRKLKLSRSLNPIVNQFWRDIATKAGGEAALENIVPYITNKFDDFTANDFIRPIVGQQESSFKFRELMDQKKILLINLSKGRLGEKNANLLGLIIVGKLFMAALSRADSPRATHAPFYLYIDEFQNVTTDSIPGILSEARKYKLSLSVAHQFLAQLEEKTRNAVFGNVGNMAVFRVGEEDAQFFEKQFAPVFKALDFVNIENRNAYVKILSGGVPQKPFDMRTPDLPARNHQQTEDLIKLSAYTYGRDRATVEHMIRERYLSQ